MNRDVPSTDHDPRTFRNFAPLPAVLLFLRLERSLRPLGMDLALHLPHGSYRSYEMGLTAPALGTLDRILAFFHLSLRVLDEKLTQMDRVTWPPVKARQAESACWPAPEEFVRAAEVIRVFKWVYVDPSLIPPPQHGFQDSAAALRWLRDFLRLSLDDLAELIGRDADLINDFESGAREMDRDTRLLIGDEVVPVYNANLARAQHLGVPVLWGYPPPR